MVQGTINEFCTQVFSNSFLSLTSNATDKIFTVVGMVNNKLNPYTRLANSLDAVINLFGYRIYNIFVQN